ncbi:MAG TPA: carboxypeptidase-like regulatory domain-containing protein [Usitatibacter sp.]
MRWFAAVLCILGFAALRSSAADEAPAAPAYEDKLIDGGNLAPLESGQGDFQYNSDGLARSWRVEGFGSYLDQGGVKRHENGLVLSGRLDTLEYGAFSADATVRADGTTSVFSFWQRGLAFDGGWVANNGAGMLNTPAIDISRNQFRFYLPTFTTLGAQTEWLRHNGDLQLQASVGTPGLYDGLRVPGFSRIGGTIATLGAQLRIDKNVTVGVQLADANNVPTSTDTDIPTPKIDSRSMYAAMRIEEGSGWTQLNLLDSEINSSRHNLAAWFDREVRDGRYRWNYGLFSFDPNMVWGYTPINADLRGGYVRANYTSQQWTWSLGLDGVAPITDIGTRGWYSTGNVRYQVDHSTGVGTSLTARTGSVPYSLAGSLFVDETTRFGSSRVQLDLVDARNQLRSQNVTFDQAWPTQVGLRLSTSLSAGREISPDSNVKRLSAAVFGGVDLTNRLSLEGNLRYSIDKDTARTTGVYANLALVWRIAQRWSLVATYYDNRSETAPFTSTLTPIIPVDLVAVIPRDRAFFLNVRYEDHAGTPTAPLGGAPGTGAGTLVGYVYYDANDNGRHDANEQGAANLTVVLDGRFAARTDKDGRFEFPLLAAGPHNVTVVPDNLALPYAIPGEGKREVIIRTRETTTLDIAATKQQ